ncbi:MAG: polyphosphate kinase 2 family protein [Chloroflexota bacterium]
MPDQRFKRMHEFIAPFRVEPGRKVKLPGDFDPAYTGNLVKKEDASELLASGVQLLSEYQEKLAAQDTWSLLIILQAMDAAGKDGTIRHVMSGVNPQGVEVTSFKVPSELERDHDYLWRSAIRLPRRGDIGIFNRSYYEELLVVRVHPSILQSQRMPKRSKGKDVWERRFREINDWERYLVDNGTKIVKLFLNVSKEEQRERFLARIGEPEKNWKFSAADARERRYWDDYQKAFSEVLSNTSTEWAPWHVIPADRKWFMRLGAAAVIIDALMQIDPQFPTATDEAKADMETAKAELLAEGPLREGVVIKGINDGPAEVPSAAGAAAEADEGSGKQKAKVKKKG